MARDFKGIWIPKEIWLAEQLTVMEKLFLVEINSLDNAEGCWANNRYFAEFFSISNSRVSEIINSLVEKGLVTSEVNESSGNRRVLRFAEGGLRETLRGSSGNADTSSEKTKHNNTSNNTLNNTLSGAGKPASPTIDEREKEFMAKVAVHMETYPKVMLREFFDYWTEKNEGGRKMRFEMQKVFDLPKRLATWKRNEKKNGTTKSTKQTPAELAEAFANRVSQDIAGGQFSGGQ